MKKQVGEKQQKRNKPEVGFIPINRNSELRCPECNRLLSLGTLVLGSRIEIKCPRCKQLCRFMQL